MNISWAPLHKDTLLLFPGAILLVALFSLLTPVSIFARENAVARSSPSLQIPDSVTLISEQDNYPLGLHLEILEDKDGAWTIEDVTSPDLSQQFVSSQEDVPGFGFTNSAYWVRFHFNSEAHESINWLLWVDAQIFYIDVYMPSSTTQDYEVIQTGTARAFDTREIDHPEFLFTLPKATEQDQTIHVRVESEGSLNLPLSIWSASAMAQEDLTRQTARGFLYGVLFILASFNFILFLFLKDRSYLYYVLFFISMLLAFFWIDNFAHQYLWPNLGGFNARAGQALYVITVIFALLFTDSFLRVKEYNPRLHRLITILVIALAAIIPIQFINFRIAGLFTAVFSIIGLVVMVLTGVLVLRKGYHPARFFLLAWFLFLVVLMISVLSLVGLLSYELISIFGLQLGLVILGLGLSGALADRINFYRLAREEAQQQIVRQQEDQLRLQGELAETMQESYKSLEERVEERTQELSFAQAQIEALFKSSPLAIGTAALDGEILSANATMARMFGYAETEMIGTNVGDLFLDQGRRAEIMEQLRNGIIVQSQGQQLRRKDGSLFYANLTESILEREGQEVILGVVDDITQQMAAEQALKEQDEVAAVAAERNRIANELHDSVTQALYSASLIAEALPEVWRKQPDEAMRSLEELRMLTQGAQAEMRTLLLELRPGELADRKLSELLRQLIDAMSARTELPISLTVAGDCQLPTEVQTACYRITQEALNNISKHARAKRAWVNLRCGQGRVGLKISDNGRGFDLEKKQVHQLGLHIMSERAEAIGADLTIESLPGQGTEVMLAWQAAE